MQAASQDVQSWGRNKRLIGTERPCRALGSLIGVGWAFGLDTSDIGTAAANTVAGVGKLVPELDDEGFGRDEAGSGAGMVGLGMGMVRLGRDLDGMAAPWLRLRADGVVECHDGC